jgi:Uma2 family endonuclease
MSHPALEQKHMTFRDAAQLDPDEQPGELEEGRWVPVTKNTWRHGQVVGNAYALLRHYAKQHPGWSVSVGDPGTKLARNPDRLRGPDVGMVRAEREPKGKGVDGWLEGAPDIVVEVIGDGQSFSELAKKALEYLSAGAKMVWVLDPDPQTLVLFVPLNQVQILGRDETLDGGDVLPGFSCRVAELFEI